MTETFPLGLGSSVMVRLNKGGPNIRNALYILNRYIDKQTHTSLVKETQLMFYLNITNLLTSPGNFYKIGNIYGVCLFVCLYLFWLPLASQSPLIDVEVVNNDQKHSSVVPICM